MNSILKIIDENLDAIDQSIQNRRKIEAEKNQKVVLREFCRISGVPGSNCLSFTEETQSAVLPVSIGSLWRSVAKQKPGVIFNYL